jgi:hypothetical protein
MNAVRMRRTYGDTRMTLTQLYAQDQPLESAIPMAIIRQARCVFWLKNLACTPAPLHAPRRTELLTGISPDASTTPLRSPDIERHIRRRIAHGVARLLVVGVRGHGWRDCEPGSMSGCARSKASSSSASGQLPIGGEVDERFGLLRTGVSSPPRWQCTLGRGAARAYARSRGA